MKKINALYASLFSLVLAGCDGTKQYNEEETQNTSTKNTDEKPMLLKPCPVFDADKAYNYVDAQVKFGARVPNTPAHKRCKDYFVEELKKLNFNPIVQNFEAKAYNGVKLTSFNIIGSYKPEASKRILLAAHWDTRPYNDKEAKDSTKFTPIDGANDGASGVGVLLEIARLINESDKKPSVGIDIIFFDIL